MLCWTVLIDVLGWMQPVGYGFQACVIGKHVL